MAQQPKWSPQPYRAEPTAETKVATAPKHDVQHAASTSNDASVQRWNKVASTGRDVAPKRSAVAALTERKQAAEQARVVPASHQEVVTAPARSAEPKPAPLKLNPPARPTEDPEPVVVSSRKKVVAAQWTDRDDPSAQEAAPAPARLRTPPTQKQRLVAQDPAILPPPSLPGASDSAVPPETNAAEEALRNLPQPGTRSSLIPDPPPGTNEATPEPSSIPNPFPKSSDSPSDRRGRDGESLSQDLPPLPPPRSERSIINCEDIRNFADELDIRNVRVDSSPNFVEGYRSRESSQNNSKDNFVAKAEVRTWYSITGDEVAQGRLVDLVYGSAVIEKEDGTRTTYLLRRLSDPDQVYVAESWGIPVTCSLGDQDVEARLFTESTFTWKASGLCHKPLYFEDVQLERYGHEWGPVVQPALSSVKFFGDLAVLPYKMGIHPPNECQYPLGYYRPGDCAPWTHGPVPISLRGAMWQAAFVTGTAWALP